VTADSPGSSTPPSPSEEKPSLAIGLIVWLLIQLAAIALAASGVALSADFPRPPQSLAVHEMLIAQFVGSAMFLSVLCRGGWRAWVGMIVTAGPMLMLAAWVAQMPMSRLLLPWGEVGMWVTTLGLWWAALTDRNVREGKAGGFQPPSVRSVLMPLAVLLSAGGLLTWYLHAEFRPASHFPPLNFFPLVAALHRLNDPSISLPLLPTATLPAVALAILAGKATFSRAAARRLSSQITHTPK